RLRERFYVAVRVVAPGRGTGKPEAARQLDPGTPPVDGRQHGPEPVAIEGVGGVGMAEMVDHDVDAAIEQRIEDGPELLAFDRDVHVPAEVAHAAKQEAIFVAAEVRHAFAAGELQPD